MLIRRWSACGLAQEVPSDVDGLIVYTYMRTSCMRALNRPQSVSARRPGVDASRTVRSNVIVPCRTNCLSSHEASVATWAATVVGVTDRRWPRPRLHAIGRAYAAPRGIICGRAGDATRCSSSSSSCSIRGLHARHLRR